MSLDKGKIFALFEKVIAADLAVLTQAALAAHDAAINPESKAEDQYDTRGLEASYLAGAQSKRAMELQELLDIFRHVDVKTFGPETPIASTALVALESEGKRYHYLLMPKGGGMSVTADGCVVHAITPQAPLGEALLGRRVGDEIEVEVKGALRDYEIVDVR